MENKVNNNAYILITTNFSSDSSENINITNYIRNSEWLLSQHSSIGFDQNH